MNILTFTFFKYVNFMLLFLRGILIASVLDIYSYSLWGVVMIATSYYSVLGLGIPNIVLTNFKDIEDSRSRSLLTGSAVFYCFSLLLLFTATYYVVSAYFDFSYANHINYYYVIIYCCLMLVIDIFRNVSRYQNGYKLILYAEFISIIPMLLWLLIKPVVITVNGMLLVLILSMVIAVVVYLKHVSITLKRKSILAFFNLIPSLGIPLLIFNFSSYIIFLLFREKIVFSYDELTVANFNFAWFASNTIILGLNLVSWYVYPLVLRKVSKGIETSRFSEYLVIQVILSLIILSVSSEVLRVILCNIFDKYVDSLIHFRFLIATNLIFYLSFYPSTYLVALDNKRPLIVSGIISVLIYFGMDYMLGFVFSNESLLQEYIGLLLASGSFLLAITYLSKIKYAVKKILVILCSYYFIVILDSNLLNLLVFTLSILYSVIHFNRIRSIIYKITNDDSNI